MSLKEILQEDPSEPFSRRRELKLAVRGTMNSIMLVNKNTVAAGALGLAVCPVLLKVLHPHPMSPVFKHEGSGDEGV